MSQDSCFSDEVTDFRKLGTGRRRRKVFVVDENHHILFPASIVNNRPSTTGRIWFDNKKSFDLRSRTLDGKRVSIFFWTQERERCWIWQSTLSGIYGWLEDASPEDVIVFGGFVAQESGRRQFWNHPSVSVIARKETIEQLKELGYVQVQRLAGMLFPAAERLAA